jgi:nucleotide-binding universal stress UspA family protein
MGIASRTLSWKQSDAPMKRLLVPVDFSPAMDGVLALARQLAEAFAAELHLLHVREIAAMPVFPAATTGYLGIGMPELGISGGLALDRSGFFAPELPNEKQVNRLDTLRDNLTSAGLRAVAHEREGAVVEEVLKAAREIAADLIIMGTHGHGSVYNLLVGSVTEGILKAGERPVLLVPTPDTEK